MLLKRGFLTIDHTIQIDGSQGEGGGQIVRSSLALSALTGTPFEITNIRSGRKSPGLLRQHLTAVKAAREVCGGDVVGGELNSTQLSFYPGPVQTRGFQFSIGSAGSATLVAQTIIPALMMADGNSSVEIEGGTHNRAAPPFDYIEQVYLPLVSRLGPRFKSRLDQYGFYPVGGGRIRIEIEPQAKPGGLELIENGGPVEATVTALVSKLPEHIGEREVQVIRRKAGWKERDCDVRMIGNSPGPGNAVMIRLSYPNVTEIFTGFGQRGIAAEQVALNAWREAKTYMDQEAPVGEHLADQLMLPLAIAASHGQASRFRTGPLTMHSQTHIDIIRMFLEVDIKVREISSLQYDVCFAAGSAG